MKRTQQLLFDTEYWSVLLSAKQAYVGRGVVVLKRKCPALSCLTSQEWKDLHDIIKRYEKAVQVAFGADLCNWSCLMNNAFREKPPQPHVHWHVRPRYSKPVVIAGKTYRDSHFSNHYDIQLDAEETPDYPLEEQAAIAECLRLVL